MRKRRTAVEIGELRDALYQIARDNRPIGVRGAFYRASALGVVPKDEKDGYQPVQRQLLQMRREGHIPWRWITDGSRTVYGHYRYNSLSEYAAEVAANYRKNYWAEHTERVEVWLEKDALRGVVSPVVVGEFGLDLHITRGQSSATYLHEAAEEIEADGRPVYIYVLTDFDPGGLKIHNSIEAELNGFLPGADLRLERIAVTPEQISIYDLPMRPAKEKDTTSDKFIREYGEGCTELDAFPPDTLRGLIRDRLDDHMDEDALRAMKLAEAEERDGMQGLEELLGLD